MSASAETRDLHAWRKERVTYYVGELDLSLKEAADRLGLSIAGVSSIWKEVKNDLGRQAWL